MLHSALLEDLFRRHIDCWPSILYEVSTEIGVNNLEEDKQMAITAVCIVSLLDHCL